jgi:Glycine rich protein
MAASLVWTAGSAQAVTKTLTYTGGERIFVVPAGVTSLQVLLIGASGGEGDAPGGAGALVTTTLAVTPGQVLYVEVGGEGEDGEDGGEGGFNGGAEGGGGGGPEAGGGGGATDIRTTPLAAGLVPDNRLVVAAGGGGGGGQGETEDGAAGGAAGNAGSSTLENGGGGAGTLIAGGSAGSGVHNGSEGERGMGGIGAGSCGPGGGGGGGGGGYFGGGGAAGGCEITGGGGGGGGSSLVPAGGSLELASLAMSPQVQITYTPPASPGGTTTTPTPPVTPPNTTLGVHPKKVVKTKKAKAKVKFGFSASVAGATFKCKLDKGSFAPCTSPKTYKVKVGKHKFSVVAETADGADKTPATFSFKVVKKKP